MNIQIFGSSKCFDTKKAQRWFKERRIKFQYMAYITPSAREEKLLENPVLFQTPIVRNGKEATVGYHPEVWETWE